MNRQLLFSNRAILKDKLFKTSRLTNSMNALGYKTFNNWGVITYEDILSNYPKETIDKCWECLIRFIVENYLGGKGTFIKGLGTFTLTNIETDLDGTTNKTLCDSKKRYPVFLVSSEFIDYIKTGIYTEKSGIIQYKQTKNGYLPIVKVNYAKISYGANISKEECYTIISSIIKNMANQIRRGIFKEKEMKDLGVFLLKDDIFGMKFNKKITDDFILKTHKLNEMKKNIRFYMETKDSEKVPYNNISDIDKAEREIRPPLSVITTITHSGYDWMKRNMSIDVKKIKESKRLDLLFNTPEDKKEYHVNQKFFRDYPLENLYGLKIPLNILEGIYNHKYLLLRNMKQKDRHGDGLLPKFDFLTIFAKTNCHHKLRIELIEKIINVYINNDPNIVMINYINFINLLCKDVKSIIDKEYYFFPIHKYNKFILSDNKRAISQNCFSRDTGNLHPAAISSTYKFESLPKIEDIDIKEDINKIYKISKNLEKYSGKMISYIELQSILAKNNVDICKIGIIQLLKYLDIKNPNVFSFDDFIKKIKNSDLTQTISYNNWDKNKNIFNYKSYYNYKNYNNNSSNCSIKKLKQFQQNSGLYNNKLNNSYDNKVKNENKRYFNNTITSGFYHNDIQKINKLKSKIISQSVDLKKNNNETYDDEKKEKEKEKEYEKYYSNKEEKNKCNNNNKDEELNINLKENEIVVNCIKLIKDKIYEEQKRLDLISEYFDVLLSYNIFRTENIIFPDEFEKVLKLEKFNFSSKDINLLFNYIDSKKDGYIDRIEFIEAIKNVPHPISTIQNYILNNNLSVVDLAYKMEIELYKIPIDDILKIKLNELQFQGKIKLINSNFTREFSSGLFNSIGGSGVLYLTLGKIFDVFNIKKDDSYKELYNKRDEIFNTCIENILGCITYFELRQKLISVDKLLTGKMPLNQFMNIMKKIINGKISETYLLHVLRMYKYIDKDNYVDYHSFILLIYLNGDDFLIAWYKCLEIFTKFLKDECENDLFLFIIKFNNMNNNLAVSKIIDENKLYQFFLSRSNMVNFPQEVIKKFDYDKDGKISQNDLYNIIINFVDKHYFDNKKQIQEDLIKSNNDKIYNENKQFYIYLKNIININNLTLDNFFIYLDNNKDNYIDKNEFINQILSFTTFDHEKYNIEKIEQFFTYLDEFKNGKIDLNTFRNKLNVFDDDINLHEENAYKGNTTIEKLLLKEMSKYYLYNSYLSDTEFFSILDFDNDGFISKEDLKQFAVKLLKMNEKELTYDKLLHFITSISSNKDENLILSDIQNFMKEIKNNDINKYANTITNCCNEAINSKNKDIKWIKEIVDILGMYISENYLNNIQQFYDDINKTVFRNKGQGLSLENIMDFMETNYLVFQSYHMNKDKYMVLFNYLSNNNKFITLEDLTKIFCSYDYYGWMHTYLTNFFRDNFPTCEDAFKFFHKVKTFKNETPNSNDSNKNNDFITKKEFYEGINTLFPNKFKTNTILNYFKIIIKHNKTNTNNEKNNDDLNIIKFSEFNYIYYNKINYDKTFKLSLKKDSKIKTTRPNINTIHFKSSNVPFTTKDHPIIKTPYDLDPLNKIKKIILSSKVDFKKEFSKFIQESDNGKANQFQFRNMIKKLNLGLTNIEIEDIMLKSGLTSEGCINLIDFYKYITEENNSIYTYKKNILESLKEMKQLLIKYYTNPKLGFELNDVENKKKIDFDRFKKIVIDLYKRDARSYPLPPYSILKSMYDFIDIRKDGIIDMNEWSKTFGSFPGKLDIENYKSNNSNLRSWEMTNNVMDVYKLIAKNHKAIKEKVISNSISGNCCIIHTDNLIKILKDVLPMVFISPTQWRMIASLGEGTKIGLVDYDLFIKIVKLSSKIAKSHIRI